MKRVSLFLEEWQIEALKKMAPGNTPWAGALRWALHAVLFENRKYLEGFKVEVPPLPYLPQDGRAGRKIIRAAKARGPKKAQKQKTRKASARARG